MADQLAMCIVAKDQLSRRFLIAGFDFGVLVIFLVVFGVEPPLERRSPRHGKDRCSLSSRREKSRRRSLRPGMPAALLSGEQAQRLLS
ncbi:MAG: hypothetical protein ACREEP_06645, partial [Dongiaceae bacterium]